ncbi:MAG TPA: hypothetical protein VJV03_09030 [Pyrinomonadaceae bacterium]|nr:hypothetical protein [Pyrinomonadaceae bacterium]
MSHLTVAVSENAFRELFNTLRDNLTFAASDSRDFGAFSASYSVAAHLEGGTIDLRNDNTVQIKELDILWDVFQFGIGFDIPELCVGGFCIIPKPWPWSGCLVRAPRICVFSADPDVSLNLDLSSIIRSEISITARPVIKYRVDPGRQSWMSDLDAEDANVPNKWQLFIDPVTVDIDVFDVADIVADLLMDAAEAAVNGLLGWLPGWAKSAILALLGGIIDLIRDILDIPDDIGEWLSDLLGVSLGFFNTIVNFVADYFANQTPLFEFEDPYPILPAIPSIPLNPVKLPVRDLSLRFEDTEMVLEANVG